MLCQELFFSSSFFLNLDFYLNKLVFTDPIDSFGRNIKFIYRLSSLNLDFQCKYHKPSFIPSVPFSVQLQFFGYIKGTYDAHFQLNMYSWTPVKQFCLTHSLSSLWGNPFQPFSFLRPPSPSQLSCDWLIIQSQNQNKQCETKWQSRLNPEVLACRNYLFIC